jgi:hypothetical protein
LHSSPPSLLALAQDSPHSGQSGAWNFSGISISEKKHTLIAIHSDMMIVMIINYREREKVSFWAKALVATLPLNALHIFWSSGRVQFGKLRWVICAIETFSQETSS